MSNFTNTTVFEVIVCCKCHVEFAMTAEFKRTCEKDHKCFSCPAGHEQYFTAKSNEEKLREQNQLLASRMTHLKDQLNETRREVRTTRKSRDAYKGHLNRTKKRIHNGVCPCCNCTFKNLSRHMTGQHPNYIKLEEK